MKKLMSVLLVCASLGIQAQNNDTVTLKNIATDILKNGTAYENLRYLCKQIGPRLSGSDNAQKAVEATARMLKEAGADTVYLQPCMVPHWVRGKKEEATIRYAGGKKDLQVCALGGSIGTPKKGLNAEVIEVQSFYELEKMKLEDVKGKIVFFNYPMQPQLINGGYGDAVRYRGNGPVAAAKKGAIATMVRSVTYALDNNPHTGATHYDDSVMKIPAIACSTMDAEWLSNLLKTEQHVKLSIKMSCETLPDAPSFNVIGEIRGSQTPQEFITCGGHLDSWDLAEGANDDGTGVTQAIEMIRAIKALDLKPKRTIRAVMFMNEENGTRGANKYADLAVQNSEKHVFAIESDEGGAGCISIGVDGKPEQQAKFRTWLGLFKPYGVLDMPDGGGGTDIGPLKKLGTVMGSINPGGQRYFDHHHAPNDVFESVNKRELELGAIAMTGIVWLVSEYGL
ncbi:MAG: M20/M25/M40 family metallo-hydrolase [Chitinophagaceae bacterium]